MDALKDACRASGDYSITLIPYYAQVKMCIRDRLYVGAATKKKLHWYGIRTIGDLAKTNPDVLAGWFGKMGYILSSFARGTDQTPVAKQGWYAAVKSIGNSATTPRDLLNDKDVWLMLVILSESIASRMRELAMKCTVVEISVRDKDLCSFIRQRKLETPTCYSMEIAQAAFALFKSSYSWAKPLRSIGVRGSNLVSADSAIQLSLLSNEAVSYTHLDVYKRQIQFFMRLMRASIVHSKSPQNSIHPFSGISTVI